MAHAKSGKPRPAIIVLNKRLRELASASADPMVQQVVEVLAEFCLYKIVGEKYDWKYLPKEAFVQNHLQTEKLESENGIYEANITFLSHLMRIIEAFEIVSTWRAADLVTGCVRSLNDDQLISSCATARALIELSVVYLEAQNVLRVNFDQIPWDAMSSHLLLLDERSAEGKLVGLESYIERLMSGTRLSAVVKVNPDLEHKNILSTLNRIDKRLKAAKAGYQVAPFYENLCEVTHPNFVGFARYVERVKTIEGGWLVKAMAEKSLGQNAEMIIETCLWSISFAAGTMIASFGEFQKLMRFLSQRIGKPLPH